MVTVTDYETQTIRGAKFYTYNGTNELGQPTYIANGPTYWFEDGFTQDDLKNIISEGMKMPMKIVYITAFITVTIKMSQKQKK